MGKYSNVILIGADGNIIDSLKRVGPDMSRMRLVQSASSLYRPAFLRISWSRRRKISQISLSPVLNIPQARCSAPSPAFQSRLRRKPQSMPAALKATCPRCAAKPYTPMAVTVNGELSDFFALRYNTFPEAQPYPPFSSL